jgi:hypothetical protein
MLIEKYSFGTGDRFGRQGAAQLAAIQKINADGIPVVPVWNKSFREHNIVKTSPADVLEEAKEAVEQNQWKGNYYIDADHIGLDNVEAFLDCSNFFTIDVAHFIGKPCSADERNRFIERHRKYQGDLTIPGIDKAFQVTEEGLGRIADNYLEAIKEVKRIFDHLVSRKGAENFIAEVSMDECELAQTPFELFFILAEIRAQGVAIQTIAPKFTGLFPKGVDYVGDLDVFAREFEEDVAVIEFSKKELGMLPSLKLSVHSGSDKFSIYPAMKKAIRKFNAGIHVKTAGTTWLEEVIGLAESGEMGLKIAREIYSHSFVRFDELTQPYVSVLDIDKKELPDPFVVNQWSVSQYTQALIHDTACSDYNRHFRQLIHVGYKIAAEMGERYLEAIELYRDRISSNVTYNIYERHLRKLLLD